MYIFPCTILEYRPPGCFKKGEKSLNQIRAVALGFSTIPANSPSDHMGVSDPLCMTCQHRLLVEITGVIGFIGLLCVFHIHPIGWFDTRITRPDALIYEVEMPLVETIQMTRYHHSWMSWIIRLLPLLLHFAS